MGATRYYVTCRDFSRPIDENRDVGRSLGVEGYRMFGECRTVWTDALLFYRTVFPWPSHRDRVAWPPIRLARNVWVAMARVGDCRRWHSLVVCYGKSVG
jgi:hypothetical protein